MNVEILWARQGFETGQFFVIRAMLIPFWGLYLLWPFQIPNLEVPARYKVYVRPI